MFLRIVESMEHISRYRRQLREDTKADVLFRNSTMAEKCVWGTCKNMVWMPVVIMPVQLFSDGENILSVDNPPICGRCRSLLLDCNKVWVAKTSQGELWETLRITDERWVMSAPLEEISRRVLIGLALRTYIMPKWPHREAMKVDAAPGPVCDIKSERIYNGNHSDTFEAAVKLLEDKC